MNSSEWIREFAHPYSGLAKAATTHGHLLPTKVKVPEYATFVVPFGWMLRSEQEALQNRTPQQLPPDEGVPFERSPWISGRARQEALLKLFSSRLVPQKSLVFFYCKEGQPLGDSIPRLVMGVGRITSIAAPKAYKVSEEKPSQLMWDLLIRHSIRPDGEDGFLLPYHEYLEPTGDPEEDARRQGLLAEIAVAADTAQIRTFSYAAEHATPDIALSTLVRCLEAVRRVRAHGIVPGPWAQREEWINSQISQAWYDRGTFPGTGPALEALGLRLGTSLVLELLSSGRVKPTDDPWPVIDSIFRGVEAPPRPEYLSDLAAARASWSNLAPDRRALLRLLSRFSFTPSQAKRWFDRAERDKATVDYVEDEQIVSNPYRMCETDLGGRNDLPVSIGQIDRGLLLDATVEVQHPVDLPSAVESPNDPRRLRAALVTVLRQAASEGDALLSASEASERVASLRLGRECSLGSDWAETNHEFLDGVIERVTPEKGSAPAGLALQLAELKRREDRLRNVLLSRASRRIPCPTSDWEYLLKTAISAAGGTFDSTNTRHAQAIHEQATAVERLVSRRLSVLVGRAGTGKTSVMGALMLCEDIAKDGILLLAPTGKARVRLGRAAHSEAMTVAQFLHKLDRYDGVRQRPLFVGETYRKEKTVVIDEASMLTMDDLAAVMAALDLVHVQRLILVGDPNQLPPIGVGRPFADLVGYLDETEEEVADGEPLGWARARLSVEVRAAGSNESSDALRLASWFTNEPQPVDADRVLSDLETARPFNDLEIVLWKSPDDLRAGLSGAFERHLGVTSLNDVGAFDASLEGDGSERWQVLSPVRMHAHGVLEINRWVQRVFRHAELEAVTSYRGTGLGDESIVLKDKVIQRRNEWREERSGAERYLANGETGVVRRERRKSLEVEFAGRVAEAFAYDRNDFPGGSGPLELAYALTVHKAQGSEFGKVFAIVPQNCKLISRELMYTALTRSRHNLVLLVQGDDASTLFDLSKPEKSETARRNTNLFSSAVRVNDQSQPYAEHLVHRSEKGHMVRSKSELVIANMLFQLGIEYDYERLCIGDFAPGRLRPDFSFATPAGDLIIWEHLGMLDLPDYRRGWEWKRDWYKANGFVEGRSLFTSAEDGQSGLDSVALRQTAEKIRSLLD